VVVVALAVALAPASLAARQVPAPPTTIGVALSGGSAKGIAHVGVLRTLERLGVRIDVVTGTSMGGVIGGMYAIGLSVDSIENVIASADWPGLISDAMPRERRSLEQRRLDERAILSVPIDGLRVTLPSGAIIGANVSRLLEHVMWRAATVRRFQDLPLPFGAVATDVETGEAVPLRSGVLSEALRASTGVPGAVEPIMLNGRLLVDGALSRNLPATDARELGASFVICSDVAEPIDSADELESLVDVLSQLASLAMLESTLAQRETCDVLILPDVEELSGFDFDQVEEWVARGEAATLAHEAALRALAGRPARPEELEVAAFLGDSVRIRGIQIVGATDPRMMDLIQRELELDVGDFVGRDQMETSLAGLETSGQFGMIRYRLDEQDGGAALTVTVEERPRDRLGVGLRYDDERRAALLFNATVHNWVGHGSITRLDLRVGEETQIGASIRWRRGLTGRLGGGVAARWSQAPLVLPAPLGGRTTLGITTAIVSLGLSPSRPSYLGVEMTGERTNAAVDAASVRSISVAAIFDRETLDRIDFPRSGVDLSWRAEWGRSDVGAGGDFRVVSLDQRLIVPMGSRVSADLGVFIGRADGAALPPHRRLSLGGAHRSAVYRTTHVTFQGLGPQEHAGLVVQVGRVGIRWEVETDWFLRAGVDIGASRDAWRLPLSRPMTGWALAGGFRSRIGPVVGEVSRLWGDRHDPRFSVSVGRSF
jgi:NTE family protein